MLAWLFHRFPRLRLVPGLPSVFDALLMGGTALLHRERLIAMHYVEVAILSWPGVTTRIHRFGGTEFTLNAGAGRREIGHLHGNGLLDIPFSRTLRDAAVSAGRAQPHHIFPRSAWVSFFIRTEADVPGATALLRQNYERWQAQDAHQPAPADVL